MGIIRRAIDALDRAQGHVTSATQHAARVVRTAPEIAVLEARQATLRSQLEQSVQEAGRLTFRRWKNGGVGGESEIAALCQRIDQLNEEYQHVLADRADLRAAAYQRSGMSFDDDQPMLPAGRSPLDGVGIAGGPDGASTALHIPAGRLITCCECNALADASLQYCPSCGMRMR